MRPKSFREILSEIMDSRSNPKPSCRPIPVPQQPLEVWIPHDGPLSPLISLRRAQRAYPIKLRRPGRRLALKSLAPQLKLTVEWFKGLGLSIEDSQWVYERDVKKVYRNLALKLHPDLAPGQGAAQSFIELKEKADALLGAFRSRSPKKPS